MALLAEVADHRPEKFASREDEDAWYYACQQLAELYLYELDQPEKAIKCLLDFRKSPKSGANTLFKLGEAYEKLGDTKKAIKYYEHVEAYEAALQFSKENADVWARYGRTIGMTSEAEISLLREKMSANLIEHWDAEQLATQQEYLEFVQSVLGERVFGAIPEGLLRDDFNP